MRLAAVIDLGPAPSCVGCFRELEYAYYPATNEHVLIVWGGDGPESVSGSAGKVSNMLVPFRGNPEAEVLYQWLCQ